MYEKTEWLAGGAPGISAQKLNKIEDGIYQNDIYNDSINTFLNFTFHNGILRDEEYLEVVFGTSSAVSVLSGGVMIGGYSSFFYGVGFNVTDEQYHSIFVRYSYADNSISIIKKTSYTGFQAPERNNDFYDLKLADVEYDFNTFTYSITDKRFDNTVCGFVRLRTVNGYAG